MKQTAPQEADTGVVRQKAVRGKCAISLIERVRNTRCHAEQLMVHSKELCESAKILIETASDLSAIVRAYRTAHPHGRH